MGAVQKTWLPITNKHMLTKAAITWLIKLPDLVICSIVSAIIMAMTGNDNFPMPDPTLPAVLAANQAALAAIAAAASGGVVLTAMKDAMMAQLAAVVRPLAYYVTVQSGGDMVKLLSSGFPIQQSSRPLIGPLPTPGAPLLLPGDMFGSITAAIAAINGAYIYNWRVALQATPTVYIAQVQTTKATTDPITGLTRGQFYLVQVNVVGAAGETEWSDVSTIMAP
jgi:hypothetical protein